MMGDVLMTKKLLCLILSFMLLLCACSYGNDNIGNDLVGNRNYTFGSDYVLLCPNYDMDMYTQLSGFPKLIIPLVSRVPIDTSEVSLTLPVSFPYTVECREIVLKDQEQYTFDSYIYLSYCDVDWKKIATDNQYYTEIESLIQEWQVIQDTGEGLPEVYAYEIVVDFDFNNAVIDESVTFFDISWPGVSFRQELGEIRFTSDVELDFAETELDAFYELLGGREGSFSPPYGTGAGHEYICEFVTKKPIVINSGYLLSKQDVLSNLEVSITATNGVEGAENSASFSAWNGEDDLVIDANSRVVINATITEEVAQSLVYDDYIYFCLEYECNGVTDVVVTDCRLFRHNNYFAVAAVFLDGVDLKSYYNDYFYPVLMGKNVQ